VLSSLSLPNFVLKLEQMCKCTLCLERINRPSNQLSYLEFVRDLESGVVEHIGQTTDGRPIYVWTGYARARF